MSKRKPLRCRTCNRKLAEYDEEGVLQIKYKDWRVQYNLTMGTSQITCPSCGWVTTLDGRYSGPVEFDRHTVQGDTALAEESELIVDSLLDEPTVCPCPHCGFPAKSPGGLTSHVRHKHPDEEYEPKPHFS